MRQQTTSTRYNATPELRPAILADGRRFDWLAQQVGVSKSFLSKVVAGRKTISESDARVLAALLGGRFAVLFELPPGANSLPSEASGEAA
jgi:hypothetical protein